MTLKEIRKIHVNGRDFLWRYPKPFLKMTIFTPDKNFVAFYEPGIILGAPMWVFGGTGRITVHKSQLPELAHVRGRVTIDMPDWSDISVTTPKMTRRVIVYTFEHLMKRSD